MLAVLEQNRITESFESTTSLYKSQLPTDHTSRSRSLFYRDSVDTGNIAETVSYVLMYYSRFYFITVRLSHSQFYLISDIMRNVL